MDLLADGRFGRMVAIRDGKYAETSLPAAGSKARRVDVEKMYNVGALPAALRRPDRPPLLLVGLGG